jgi:hypothetical protein
MVDNEVGHVESKERGRQCRVSVAAMDDNADVEPTLCRFEEIACCLVRGDNGDDGIRFIEAVENHVGAIGVEQIDMLAE